MGAKLLPEWRAASARSPEGRSGLALDANSLCWNSEGKGGQRGGQITKVLTCHAKEFVGIGEPLGILSRIVM